jgi:uncharacterized integral membrane protein
MSFRLISILVIVALALIFVLQNVAAVEVNFLTWTVSMSRALLILITLAIGFVLGWLLHSYAAYRKSRRAPFDRF